MINGADVDFNNFLKNVCIGIDIVEVGRFKDFKYDSVLARNIFTKKELKECRKKNSPIQSLAARFAAKEAVKKTIKHNIKFNVMEVTSDKDGSLKVEFLDKKIKRKYKSIISIAHTEQFAQAVCLTFMN